MVNNTLGKEDEYRQHAAALLELAARTANNTDKGRLLLISEAWKRLLVWPDNATPRSGWSEKCSANIDRKLNSQSYLDRLP